MNQATPGGLSPVTSRTRLLVVVDESDSGPHTAAIGVAMAARMQAEVVFLIAVAIEPIDAKSPASVASAMLEHGRQCRERTQPRFDEILLMAGSADVPATSELTIGEEPTAAVIRVATERACDLIVVGSQPRGRLSQLIHASLAAELVRLAPRPVVVCRDDMAFGPVEPVGDADPAVAD